MFSRILLQCRLCSVLLYAQCSPNAVVHWQKIFFHNANFTIYLMKYFFSLLPLLLLITARSCDKKIEKPEAVMINFGDTITLAYQQKVFIGAEKLQLTYSNVRDSRCPLDVNCIRAGEAKVSILLEQDGTQETVELEAKGLCTARNGKCGNRVQKMGYDFQLFAADPYPEDNPVWQQNHPEPSVLVVVNKMTR